MTNVFIRGINREESCAPFLHFFEFDDGHPYNQPENHCNVSGFPYGHSCKCGAIIHIEPFLDTKIKPGTMIYEMQKCYACNKIYGEHLQPKDGVVRPKARCVCLGWAENFKPKNL